MNTNIQKKHKLYLLKKKLLGLVIKISFIFIVLAIIIWISTTLFIGKGKSFFLSLIASNLLNIEVKPVIISGITSKGLKYNITSETIENYISNFFYKNNMNFAKPTLKLELDNGNIVNVNSRRGEFDQEKNLFYLKNKVELLSSNGAYLESSLITLDINNNNIFSNVKTTLIDRGNYLYSKGFILYNDFNKLKVYGSVVISDMKISDKSLYNKDLFIKNYLRTTGNIEVDNIARTIMLDSSFFGFKDQFKFSAEIFKANYLKLEGFKDSGNAFDNFSRIEMDENVRIYNSKSNGLTTGDKYIYDVIKNIMIITSRDKLTKYEDKTYIITVKDRFEFNTDTHIAVARGKPHLVSKNTNNEKSYDIKADLAYAKLKDNTNEIEYAEIFDNIVIESNDGSLIYADYGYLDYLENILYLEDNVKIINKDSVLESCKIILDIKTGLTKLVRCDDQESFRTTINKTIDR